jgi:hypothetical protein
MVKKIFLGLIISIFIFILSSKLSSAYIDPGTGGYLATTFFSTFVTSLAVAFAAIVTFLSVYFIKPLKSFISKKKKVILFSFIFLILIISLLIYFSPSKSPNIDFDSSLSGPHIYNRLDLNPSYYFYEGKLIDVNGNLINNWSSIYLGVIDENGDYYAQQSYESLKWGRYTWNDEIIWEMDLPIHHEIVLTPENTIITFTKETHEYNGRLVEFDIILELDKNGKIIDRWSTWDNLEYIKTFHKPLELEAPPNKLIPEEHKKNKSIWGAEYDYYHLNSLSLVPNNSLQGIHPAFNPGNWIISFRHGSMLFILDKNTKEILWSAIYDQVEDNLEGPHTPLMNSEGNILVFDNGRYREWSRIILINPLNLNIIWEYKTKNPMDFYSLSQGQVQILPNKNLLITESEKGRVFELTPNKKIVWEFYNQVKQDETNSNSQEKYGLRQEIYRMTAYEKSFIDKIIQENS